MTLATLQKWDVHIDYDLEQGLSEIDREGQIKMLRLHIERWRVDEWTQIKQQLASEYNWHIRDGIEPFWTAPGRCVLWQRHIVTVRKKGNGKNASVRLEKVDHGFQATSQGMSVNNPSQFAAYFEKGFRLRPPENGVDIDVFRNAVPDEILQADAEQETAPIKYICTNHVDSFGFSSWKSYLKHCLHHSEQPTIELPDEVIERSKNTKYFCVIHNTGFHGDRLANQHITHKHRSGVWALTLEQMLTNKNQGGAIVALTYGTIWGNYGDEKATGETKLHALGTRMVLPDNRVFRYAENAGTALHAGVVVQAAAATAADDVDVPLGAQASVGDGTITVTAAGTIAKDHYADGFIFLNDGTGEGTIYKIASNAAGTNGNSMVVTLVDGDTVRVATDSTAANTLCGLALNTYKDVIISPTTVSNVAIGVSTTSVTADYYCWLQTWGEAAVLANAAGVIGQHVRVGGASTAGGTEDMDFDGSGENEQLIGVQMQIAPTAAADYGMIFLQISP